MGRWELVRGGLLGCADVMLALSESVDDPVYRKALNHAAGRDLLQQSAIRERIACLVDLRDIAPEQADSVELEQQALAITREWPDGMDAPSFWRLLGGSLEISRAEKRQIIGQLATMDLAKVQELITTLHEELAGLCSLLAITEQQLAPYLAAVRCGGICHRYDLEGACAVALHEGNSDGLGNLLQDHLTRYEEAEAAYLHALELNPNDEFIYANLAYLNWLHLDKPEQARHYASLARAGLANCGKRLLDAMEALSTDALGLAWDAFDAALATEDAALWVNHSDDLQRVLRYAVAQGYGLKFKEWMEAADYGARYAPLYWAFLALLEGPSILLNVSPEVRRTAESIYRGLSMGAVPAPAPKKGRKTKK